MAVFTEAPRLSGRELEYVVRGQEVAAFLDVRQIKIIQTEVALLLEFLLAPHAVVASVSHVEAVVKSLSNKLWAVRAPAAAETNPAIQALHQAGLEAMRIWYGTTAQFQERITVDANLSMEEGLALRVQLLRQVIAQLFQSWGLLQS